MKAVPRTCPPCLDGHHKEHSYGWNLSFGRGAYCPCEGECVAYLDREQRMFAAYRQKGEND